MQKLLTKKHTKRLCALVTATMMTFAFAMPVSADSGSMEIVVNFGSSYTVTIPASLTLADDGITATSGDVTANDGTYSGKFNVGCSANLRSSEYVYIELASTSITLTGEDDPGNTATATATLVDNASADKSAVYYTKDGTSFKTSTGSIISGGVYTSNSSSVVNAPGRVTVPLTVSDNYTGTASFTYGKATKGA